MSNKLLEKQNTLGEPLEAFNVYRVRTEVRQT